MALPHRNPVYATLAGFALIGAGLCLARYAYTPLIPALIHEGWATKSGAGFLGGFNCLGYILGCGAALGFPRWMSIRRLLRISLICLVVGLGMCAWNGGFAWLALGRAITGFGGASLVIHTPAVALAHVPDAWKKVSNGILFSGAGTLVMVISLCLPIFLAYGVPEGWLFEAGVAVAAAIIAWPLTGSASQPAEQSSPALPALESNRRRPLTLIAVAYFLAAVGIIPHTLFLSDYLHRDLGTSMAEASQLFALVGAGSLVGAAMSGVLARWWGTLAALLANYVIGAAAVAMILLSGSVALVSASAVLIGFFLMQCVALTSVRTSEIAGPERHPRWWGILTLGFGLGLAAGSYGFSGLLSLGLDYLDTFRIAQGILILALLLCASSWRRAPLESR